MTIRNASPPLFPLLGALHLVPAPVVVGVPVVIALYGLAVAVLYGFSVIWLSWKPSLWPKLMFIAFSALWSSLAA
jgi:hypothetical protein